MLRANRNEKIGWSPGRECLQAPPWESVHSFKELFLMFGSKHLDDVMDTVTPTSPSPPHQLMSNEGCVHLHNFLLHGG